MQFHAELIRGKLIARYKRFLADIKLENGEIVTAHCTNSGSMKSCIEIGAPVYISKAQNQNRKTNYTWEMILISNRWVGINTLVPNTLIHNALKNNELPEIGTFEIINREMTFRDSRFDFYAENQSSRCFIEVKNVTMKDGRFARFPDAVTSRGTKHLKALISAKESGFRAIMIYVIQRSDIDMFATASNIDPLYSKTLKEASRKGVEIFPLMASVNPKGIHILRRIPYDLTK